MTFPPELKGRRRGFSAIKLPTRGGEAELGLQGTDLGAPGILVACATPTAR